MTQLNWSIFVCLALASVANTVDAEILDQAATLRPTTSGWSISDRNAQTVTVGNSGQLSRIELQIFQSDARASGDLYVELFGVNPDGSPDTTSAMIDRVLLLNSQIPLRNDIDNGDIVLTSADFMPNNLLFDAGDQFAIVLNRTDQSSTGAPPWMIWSGPSQVFPSDYAGGSFYLNTSNGWEQRVGDHGVRTFMATAVPEPGSTGLLFAASSLVLWQRQRKTRGSGCRARSV